MKIRHIVLLIAALASLLIFGTGLNPVFAQTDKEPGGFSNVRLWLNPEYDDPRLLVMLEGKITGAEAPVAVRFLVPTAAEMYSAGSMDARGNYSGGPPQRQPSSVAGWDEISYELKTDTFRMEYYDPIILGQPDKKIAYDFRSLYPISDLRVIVQEPLKSTAFTVSAGSGVVSSDQGFTVHLYDYNNLGSGPPLHFDIAYTKTDPGTSLTLEEGESAGTSQVIGIIVGVCVVIAAGFIWVMKSIQRARPKRKAAVETAGASRRKRPGGRFCTHCGQPVDDQARFCPHCGSKLRGPG